MNERLTPKTSNFILVCALLLEGFLGYWGKEHSRDLILAASLLLLGRLASFVLLVLGGMYLYACWLGRGYFGLAKGIIGCPSWHELLGKEALKS